MRCCERGDLLMGAGRARLPALAFGGDGRLPFRAGAMLALERDELGLGFADAGSELDGRFLGGSEIGFQRLHAAEGLHGGLGFGKLGVGFQQGFLCPLFRIGDAGELGLRFTRLTLHCRQGLACLREAALTIPPELTQAPFLAVCPPQAPGGFLRLAARCFGGAALHVLLPGKDPEAAALLQSARRGNGALRGSDKAVPAPQVALHRHQTLARLELTLQPRAIRAPHDADLHEPPRQLRRSCNTRCKRLHAGQQLRVGHRSGIERPAHRRTSSGRCIQIVAERCRQRQLVPGGHLDVIQHRRQAAVAGRLQKLGECLHLGPELSGSQPDFGCQLALGGCILSSGLDRSFGSNGLLLDLGDIRHELLAGLRGRLQLGGIRRTPDDLAHLRFERGELPLELLHTLPALQQLSLCALPAGPRFGRGRGDLAEPCLGILERGGGLVVGGQRLALEVRRQLVGIGKRLHLAFEAGDGFLGLGNQRLFARAVARELLDAGLQIQAPLGIALGLAFEVLLLDLEAMQNSTLGGLLLAQRLELLGRLRLGAQGLGFGFGRPAHFLERGRQARLFALDLRLRLHPPQMQHDGVELADFGRQLLVAPRLPCLALQAFDLGIELAQDVVEAREVAFRRPQAQFRLVPAAVQARRCLLHPPGCAGAARAWR